MNLQFNTVFKRNTTISSIQRIATTRNIQLGVLPPGYRQPAPTPKPYPPAITESDPATKKMKWGEPTWILLHTLCEKVKDNSFDKILPSLLNIIYIICTNLPCPDCSAHAKQYLDSIRFKSIQTKPQLKKIMFDFHNSLNARKGFPIFKYADLNKYSTAITINVIYNFMNYYSVKNRSIHMISNDIYRNNIIIQIKEWFNVNIKLFDL